MPETTPMANDTAKILVQNRASGGSARWPVQPHRTQQRGDIGRQPDREARKDDVERDGEGELQPRQQDGIEIHGFAVPGSPAASAQFYCNMSASLSNSARAR